MSGDPVDYYDRQGQPITAEEYRTLKTGDMEYRRIGLHQGAGFDVSTVWIGIAVKEWMSGPPLIFETLVSGGPLDNEHECYATEADAIAGHARWVTAATAASA